jgi:hypothetical protein
MISANTENIHQFEEQCKDDASAMAEYLASQGLLARYACFKVGTAS